MKFNPSKRKQSEKLEWIYTEVNIKCSKCGNLLFTNQINSPLEAKPYLFCKKCKILIANPIYCGET